MKYLYYCNSPYQLFNIINLNWHRKYNSFENIKNYESELIILNAFGKAEEMVEILNKDEMFSKVMISNRFKNEGFTHKLSSLLDVIFPSRFIYKSIESKKCIKRNYYDVLCMPKVSKLTLSFWLLNKKSHIELYEEGFGTFCGSQHMCHEKGNHQKLYSFLNNGRQLGECFERLYLNEKILYLKEDVEKLVTIPKIDNKCLTRIQSLFKDVLFNDRNKKIYWMGQYINDNVHNITKNCLVKYQSEVLYCPHPRFKKERIKEFENFDNNNFWELNISKIKNINDVCIITIHSTAALSPKLLYDKEPYVIFTINMAEDRYSMDNIMTYEQIERFRSTYTNPEKVMTPNNEEELKECLEKYASKVGIENVI